MKKIIALLMLLVSLATANAKCDWSTLKLKQWDYTEYNYYKWQVSGQVLDDTCVDYTFMVYDFQTKRIDTLNSLRGISEVRFYKNGKYKMYLKVWNKCLKCDTALYREINVTNIINFSSCRFTYNLKNTEKCKDSIVGEMTLGPWIKGDTCWEWYSWIWNGPMLDSISQNNWDSISDWELWSYYGGGAAGDLKWKKGPTNDARIIKYKFPKNGRYLIATQWYNSCLDQDTVFFTRITINCNTSGVKMLTRPEPKLVAMYDIMGRPVQYVRENEITIYLYSDGSTRKVIKK